MPGNPVVQNTAAAYRGAEDALAAARDAINTLIAQTDKSALPAVASALAPWPRVAGRRHLARLDRALGAVGQAMEEVVSAHVEIEAWRNAAGLPPVITPRDGGGGK